MQSVDQVHRKRLAFAQEIRDRQRSSIKESIKLSFQHSQLLKHLMQDPSANIKDLYLLITNQKQYELEVIQHLLAWLPSHEMVLHSREQAYYWTIILTAIIDHHPQAASFILNKAFQKLFQIFDQINNYDMIFVLLTTALTACKRQKIGQQQIPLFLQTLLNHLNSLQRQEATLVELQFYHYCFRDVPELMCKYISEKFIMLIVKEFKRNIDDREMIKFLVRILVSITYYQESYFDGQINEILKNYILPQIKFKLQFLDLEESPQLIHDLCLLTSNIIICIRHVHIQTLKLESTLLPFFSKQSKCPEHVQKIAMKTFLLILFFTENDQEQRDYLRGIDVIEVIIFIMRDHGEAYPEILQDCMESLHTLFQLQRNHINSYLTCFKYKGGYEVLQHYPEWHDRLVQMYPEP